MPGQHNPLSQHWTDILPLMPPSQHAGWLLLSAVVLLLLVILSVYVLWQQSPRWQAYRSLRRCSRQLQMQPEASRRIAHTVYRVLLQGLGMTPVTVLQHEQLINPQWQTFHRRLQHCVFQASPPTVDELAGLIQQARDWLRQGLR